MDEIKNKYLVHEPHLVAFKAIKQSGSKITRTQYDVNGKSYMVVDSDVVKMVFGEDYNYVFYKNNGFFARWGRTIKEDPDFSPIGPEIWDCEITTICKGVPNMNGNKSPCRFCYKANTEHGKNMSFETFKKMFDSFSKNLTQIAFGSDSECTSNPDIWKMMEYCRENGVIPNITVANITDETADKLAKLCGAVAVSRYENKESCYDSIYKLALRGMKQINIHVMVSMESYDMCMETLHDRLNDYRLAHLNAIVLLGLKKKGRAINHYNTISTDKLKNLINFAFNNDISIGFDSCTAPKFNHIIDIMDCENREQIKNCIESCESGIMSFYTNVDAKYFPCSFTEGQGAWNVGIDMCNVNDFFKDIWYNERNMEWRNNLIGSCKNGCRQCLTFPEINKV